MKNFKHIMFFIIFGVLNLQAQVFKIQVKNCETKANLITGSGITFNYDNSQYILTTEHLALTQKNTCFFIQIKQDQFVEAKLLNSDWESGLALLKVSKPLAQVTNTIDSFSNDEVKNSDQLETHGYPAKANSLLTHKAEVVLSDSSRSPFVNLDKVIEIFGAHLEFGMSGGAFINSNQKTMGLLAAQRLLIVPGSSSQIILANHKQYSNHAIVIPSTFIKPWLVKNLVSASTTYSRHSGQTISLNGILFKQSELFLDDKAFQVAGGGDGVGTTGEEDDNDTGVEIEISLDQLDALNFSNEAFMDYAEIKWLKSIYSELLRLKVFKIKKVVIITDNEIKFTRVQSLAHFIQLMRNNNAYPIIENENQNKLAHNQSDLMQLKNQLATILVDQKNDPEIVRFLNLIISLIDLKSQNQNFKLSRNQILNLLNNNSLNYLSASYFDLSVEMRRFFMSLGQ